MSTSAVVCIILLFVFLLVLLGCVGVRLSTLPRASAPAGCCGVIDLERAAPLWGCEPIDTAGSRVAVKTHRE